MLKITRWKPDTCDCVLEYEWDDSQNENERVHTAARIVSACEFHKNSGDKHAHFDKILKENRGKNMFFKKLMDNIPSAFDDVEDEEGNVSKVLKKGKKYEWSFDKDRNLEVDLKGFTESEKNTAKDLKESGIKIK